MMMNPAVINNMVPSAPSEGTRLNDLPTDTRLPQLPIILDVEVMREKLQRCMFTSAKEQTQFTIRDCAIVQIRYKPGSSCMVSYRLHIENMSTGESGEQIVCGRAFPEGRSQSRREKAEAHALVQPRFGKPLIHLPEIEMVLWNFPNDRKMHTLPAMIQLAHSTPGCLSQWLLAQLGTEEWQVVNTHSRVVHYVGEHTCTVQTTLEALYGPENSHRIMTIYGKTYYNDEGAQTDRIMRQLWNSRSRRSGQLHMAQPLWYDARLKTLWQLGIQGTTLESYAIEDPESVSLLKEAARTIAIFHATPLSNIRSVTIPYLIEKLGTVGSMLIHCQPSCQPILLPLLTRLTVQAKMIPTIPTATLHGDLHLKNLFLTDGKIALIDLDNVCEGPPGLDIGSFIAGLLTTALAKGSSLSRITSHLETFLNHYHQSVTWKVNQSTLAWFTAVALVIERSHRCITRLKDNQRGQVEALLNLADQISEALSFEPLADGWIDAHRRNREL